MFPKATYESSPRHAWTIVKQAHTWRRQYNRSHPNEYHYYAPGSHEEQLERFRFENWDDIGPDDDD